MKPTLAIAVAAIAALCLAGCSSGDKPTESGTSNTPGNAAPASKQDAASAFKEIAATVTTAKQNGTVTAASDPNHLLGRPGQYTSKITFSDSRVLASDRAGYKAGDVELGGAVETFSTAADAAARAKYIQGIARSMPALAEYDYVHGPTVIRISHYLTPQQAGQYKTAVAKLQ